jgi:hypothetical protein
MTICIFCSSFFHTILFFIDFDVSIFLRLRTMVGTSVFDWSVRRSENLVLLVFAAEEFEMVPEEVAP